jgi:hypothetical protein
MFEMVGSGSHAAAVTKEGLPFLFADGFGFVGTTTLQNHQATTKPFAPSGSYQRAGENVLWVKGRGTETLARHPNENHISASLAVLNKHYFNLGSCLVSFELAKDQSPGGVVEIKDCLTSKPTYIGDIGTAKQVYADVTAILEGKGCGELRDVVCLLLCVMLRYNARNEIQCG